MKIRTRLVIAFLTITLIPIILTTTMGIVLCRHQISSIEKTYGVTDTTWESLSNSMQVLSKVTEKPYEELKKIIAEDPEEMGDATRLEKVNKKLEKKKAYLLVRKGNTIVYIGTDSGETKYVIRQLPKYGEADADAKNGLYLGGNAQVLIKQIDFKYRSGEKGSAFIVTDMKNVIPEVEELFVDLICVVVIVLIATAFILLMWIYRGIMRPLSKMKRAAYNIKEGNLDFEIKPESDDELGQLCSDLEDMRKRLKDSAEEKIQFDKENKELISNISHDLKTPITAIKGYVEGIMDGVASSPEKLDKYIRTIYNKANDMDRLIDELTFYSKIDTNKIPYTFSKINVSQYFRDCVEEVGLDMEARGIELGYFNYVDEDVVVIADAEQMKRVINNIISNSVKYLDKKKGIINIRIKDDGDFIQVEIEDNGKGIAAKDLPNIFDRFYRTDSSRNSSQGGSGIGLSIVRKIIEDHGGRIWATSKEGIGTEVHFVLRKYQEVVQE